MPTRLVREGILSSEAVCSLSWAAEVLYRRLMSVADDYGRFTASPKLIRAACYPQQIDKVSDSDIGKWLAQVAEAGLVRVYPAEDGKRYLQIEKFGQQIRSKSKYPQPPEVDPNCQPPPTPDSNCYQVPADAQQPQADVHLGVFVFGGVSEVEVVSETSASTTSPTVACAREGPPEPDVSGHQPTRAGAICRALKATGLTGINPGNPVFRALVDAGADEAEWLGAAQRAVAGGKGFGWVVAAVEGERKRAAQTASQVHHGPMPAPPLSERGRRNAQWLEGTSLDPKRRQSAQVIDIETLEVGNAPRAIRP